jgi:formylglycine-generating enzyme required for sulfatase activity
MSGVQMRSANRVPAKDWHEVGSRSFQRSDNRRVTVSSMTVMRRLAKEGDYGAVCHELSSHKETHALLVQLANGHEVVHDLGTEVELGRRKDPALPARVVRAYPDHDSRMEVLRRNSLGNPEDPATYLLHEQAVVAAHQLGGRLLTEAEWQVLASDLDDPFIFQSLDIYKDRFNWNFWEWNADRYGDYNPSQLQDPTGSIVGDYRVSRGGVHLGAPAVRAADRNNDDLVFRSYDLGFRVRSLLPQVP